MICFLKNVDVSLILKNVLHFYRKHAVNFNIISAKLRNCDSNFSFRGQEQLCDKDGAQLSNAFNFCDTKSMCLIVPS